MKYDIEQTNNTKIQRETLSLNDDTSYKITYENENKYYSRYNTFKTVGHRSCIVSLTWCGALHCLTLPCLSYACPKINHSHAC